MKIHTEVEQGSEEWLRLRAGKVTASEASKIVTPTGKVSTGDGVKTFLMEKLAERWIGLPLPNPDGIFDMQQGKFLEDWAFPAFTVETDLVLSKVGFIETDSDDGACGDLCGCSPDGVVMNGNREISAGCEIKCPRLETHIRYLMDGGLPKQYAVQVQFSMYVTGLSRWHFYSFRRKMPNLHVVVERDQDYMRSIDEALMNFKAALDDGFQRLCKLNGGAPKRIPVALGAKDEDPDWVKEVIPA